MRKLKTFYGFRLTKDLTEKQLEIRGDMMAMLFNIDKEGVCWYDRREEFAEDTLKVKFMDDGVIVSYDMKPYNLYPEGANIGEVSLEDVPADFKLPGYWLFKDNKIVVDFEGAKIGAERFRDRKMSAVTEQINQLVAAEEDGDITPAEDVLLAKLRSYRSTLRRMPLDDAPNVKWPDLPVLEEEE